MKNVTMDDLLKPLIEEGYDIQEVNRVVPTFIVKCNDKQHTFEYGIDKVPISPKQPSPEGIVEWYTNVVKALSEDIKKFDWSK